MANDRLLGGGLTSESPWTFARYAPDPTDVHAAHSIFFGVLGDHGWPGLILFVLIFFMAWRNFTFVIRETAGSNRESDRHKNLLARMLQVSLIAYASGGAFLSLAYFDLPWHVVAISILLKSQLGQEDASDDCLDEARSEAEYASSAIVGKKLDGGDV